MNEQGYILVGLGNPGRAYAGTRHNVGFALIDRLTVLLNAGGMRLHSDALVTRAAYEGKELLLAKPQTYMNLSGRSVQGLSRFYKTPMDHLLVAHDDLDIPLGSIRLRPGGGPGGQKGVQSAIDSLGSQHFVRLRIGIGRPPGRMDPAAYVLQRFRPDESDILQEVLGRAVSAALAFVVDGLDATMSKFNGGPDRT